MTKNTLSKNILNSFPNTHLPSDWRAGTQTALRRNLRNFLVMTIHKNLNRPNRTACNCCLFCEFRRFLFVFILSRFLAEKSMKIMPILKLFHLLKSSGCVCFRLMQCECSCVFWDFVNKRSIRFCATLASSLVISCECTSCFECFSE